VDKNKIFGWLMLVVGGWDLFSGIFTNDMGGLASLGYNPDVPMSFGRAPLRFIIGLVINSALVIYGLRLIRGQQEL